MEGGPAVLVEEEPPELGEELGVGLVPSEHADEHPPVVILGVHVGPAARLGMGQLDVAGVDAELGERGPHLRVGRATARRPEREMHRGRDTPAEHDGREHVVGKAGPEVQGRRGHEQHGQLPDPTRRAREVRRRRGDDGDDHREAHHRVRRAVVESGDDPQALPEALVTDEHHAQEPTDEPREDAREREVVRKAPPARDERGDADQPDGPE